MKNTTLKAGQILRTGTGMSGFSPILSTLQRTVFQLRAVILPSISFVNIINQRAWK